MQSLNALAGPDLQELTKDFPRGGNFQHVVGSLIRQVVFVLADRLRDLGVPLRISIEPKSDRRTKSGEPRLPVSMTLHDGDLRFAIPIVTMETSCIIGEKLVRTGGRDDAVQSVAAAIITAIQNVLGNNEE